MRWRTISALHQYILHHILIEADANIRPIALEDLQEGRLHIGVDEKGSSLGTTIRGLTEVRRTSPKIMGITNWHRTEHPTETFRPTLLLPHQEMRATLVCIIRYAVKIEHLVTIFLIFSLELIGITNALGVSRTGCHWAYCTKIDFI